MENHEELATIIMGAYQKILDGKNIIRSKTGIIYDERMSEHKCLWDDDHPESPERFTRIIERCNELQLIKRCERLPSRQATKEEILAKHTEELYDKLQSNCQEENVTELENLSSDYDSVYFHPSTFELSLLACGSALDLVKNIIEGNIQNGMAIIRPPGHHAMKSEFNGFCFFNNVAVAAQYALDNLNLKRILIVDWDIHHGQGTQRLFYDDPRVVYFSIHRFEFGKHWPNLKDSNYDFVGTGQGTGFNFNLPLNDKGMQNGDYMAIFNQILIPVAVEYQPELIIISAGFDSALGCPLGEMEVTPAFYPHLLNSLLGVQSRIAVVLEGGYCLDSLSEGASLTLRTLLGDPCPIVETINEPCELVRDAILSCIYSHRDYWKCLQIQEEYAIEELDKFELDNLHIPNRSFEWDEPLPEKYPTRGIFEVQDEDLRKSLEKKLNQLKEETILSYPKVKLCYIYDDVKLGYLGISAASEKDQLDRVDAIIGIHKAFDLMRRTHKLKCRYATVNELCLAHTEAYVKSIKDAIIKDEDLINFENSTNTDYFKAKTFEYAKFGAGCGLQVVDNVLNGNSRAGLCIINPPENNAEKNHPHGSSVFNNIAIAAQYAIEKHGLKRVLILNWDIYHGKNTQEIFESNSKVLYMSVHRYDNATFYPNTVDANYTEVGHGSGVGFNVNIPWNKDGMGDLEYSLVFQNIILPIAYEYNPELILVSAGFGAVLGNTKGGCKVSPQAYGCFTYWLSSLANGKIILFQDGGYNFKTISLATVMCSKALLGDPIPSMNIDFESSTFMSCLETINDVISIQSKYWKRLKFNKKLPATKKVEDINEIEKRLGLLTVTDSQLTEKEQSIDEPN